MPESTKKKEERSGLAIFAEIIAKMEPAKLTAEGGGGNYKYKFAPLAEVERVIRDATAGTPVVTIQSVTPTDHGTHLVTTQAIDAGTGEVLNSVVFESGPASSPQELGSWNSYLRRYGLGTCYRIVTEDDDDGAIATPKQGGSAKPQPKKQQPTIYDAPKLPVGTHVVEVTGCKLTKETPKWKLWFITTPKGEIGTFDATVAGTCMAAAKSNRVVELTVETGKKGRTAATKAVLTDIDQPPQDDDESWIPPDDEENF